LTLDSRAYWALVVADLKMYLRRPVAVWLGPGLMLAFIVVLRLLSFGSGGQLNVAVSNASRTPASADLVYDIKAIPTFRVYDMPEDWARYNFDTGRVELVVVIPPGLGSGGTTQVGVLYRQGVLGNAELQLLQSAFDRYNLEQSRLAPVARLDARATNTRAIGVAGSLLSGLAGFNLVQSGLLLAAGLMASYRLSGVLKRIQATGVDPGTFVFAHATSAFLVGFVQTAVLLVAGALLFSIQFDVVPTLVVIGLGYFVFLALGFAISAWITEPMTSTVVASVLGTVLIVIGFIPVEALPAVIGIPLGLLPISMVTDGVRHAGLGGDLSTLLPDVLGLIIWAAVLVFAAGRSFNWQPE